MNVVPDSPSVIFVHTIGNVSLEIGDDHVAVVEIHNPPHNFFSLRGLVDLAGVLDLVDADPDARAVLLCAEGKNFCAGADFGASQGKLGANTGGGDDADLEGLHLYDVAVRLFATPTPIVAAVQGAAIGGGLGLACMADFRIGGPASRFSANFARLGFHHGFGLSVTLPEIVGRQAALELLYTGRRIDGKMAQSIGLIDRFATDDHELRDEARELAAEIAGSAPLAVRSIRQTMRGHLPDAIRAATDREREEQETLTRTDDWKEGLAAMSQRRAPEFKGR